MIRSCRITFLVTEEERKILEEAAKSVGIPVGTLCRMAAIEKSKESKKEEK